MNAGNGFPIHRSIRIRFAAIIALIAAIAISIVAWIFSAQFDESLTTNIKDELLKDAEASASAVGDRVQIYANRFTSFLNPHVRKSREELRGIFTNFLENDQDFLMLSTYEVEASTGAIKRAVTSELLQSQASNPLFFDREPVSSFAKIQKEDLALAKSWSAEVISGTDKSDFRFFSTATSVQVPVFTIFANFKSTAKSGDTIMVSATIWMTALMTGLPKASGLETVLIDERGTAVGSAIFSDVVNGKSYEPFALAKFAFSEKSGSGFYSRASRPEFYDFFPEKLQKFLPDRVEYRYPYKKMLEWVGAYARVQRMDLGMTKHTVLVQKKADYVFGVLERSLRDTFLVALFVIFGAAVVGAIWATESTVQLKNVYRATAEIAAGNFSIRIPSGSADEIGQIAKSVNYMAEELKSQVELKAEKGRLQAEADTARTVQETFFPEGTIESGFLRISGGYQPATECGGDLWGHYSIRPGVELVYIADAMGHGASAAIMTAMAYTSCNLISDFFKGQENLEESPAALLEKMNAVIYGAVKGKISITCFVVVYDFNRGEMVYANAGHNFPFLSFRKSGAQSTDSTTAQSLMSSGNPLGVAPDSAFTDKRRPIAPGERLVLFTDGLIECRSPEGQMWGRKALSGAVRTLGALDSIEEIRNAIAGRAFSFFGNQPIDDDVTLVVAEVMQSWTGATHGGAGGSPSPSGSSSASAEDNGGLNDGDLNIDLAVS